MIREFKLITITYNIKNIIPLRILELIGAKNYINFCDYNLSKHSFITYQNLFFTFYDDDESLNTSFINAFINRVIPSNKLSLATTKSILLPIKSNKFANESVSSIPLFLITFINAYKSFAFNFYFITFAYFLLNNDYGQPYTITFNHAFLYL